jgi:hypothetical protein
MLSALLYKKWPEIKGTYDRDRDKVEMEFGKGKVTAHFED